MCQAMEPLITKLFCLSDRDPGPSVPPSGVESRSQVGQHLRCIFSYSPPCRFFGAGISPPRSHHGAKRVRTNASIMDTRTSIPTTRLSPILPTTVLRRRRLSKASTHWTKTLSIQGFRIATTTRPMTVLQRPELLLFCASKTLRQSFVPFQ